MLALALMNHRLWGHLFIPYTIRYDPGNRYFNIEECLSPYPSDTTLALLTDEGRETVRIINEYNDRALYKLFSKDRNVKEFLENVNRERIDRIIRPYIERRISKCFNIARDEGIPCFQKRSLSGNVHIDDQLELMNENAKPVFYFERGQSGSTYKLKIEVDGKEVRLFNNNVNVLCNSPCIIVENQRLIHVNDIDGAKLKPFLSRESITIPANSEMKYFSGFVRDAVNRYKVEGSGFTIIEPVPEKSAHLNIELGLKGNPMLVLSFDYSGNTLAPDDQDPFHTIFLNEAGEYSFIKYRRDKTWEKSRYGILLDMGFVSDDNVNYYLPENGSGSGKELHAMIEAINRNHDAIIDAGFTIAALKLDRDYNLKPVTIAISNSLEEDWFDLKAMIRIGDWEFAFSRFRHNIIEGKRDFELPDGTIAILPEEWFAIYRCLFDFGRETSDSIRIHKQHFSLLSGILDNKEPEGLGKLEKLLMPEQLPVISKPEGLHCSLRDYQAEGLSWLAWLKESGLGGCLADDMGLGKTIQALALLQHYKENRAIAEWVQGNDLNMTSIVIVPATLVYNWENEIRRFAPGMMVYSHKGAQRDRDTSRFSCFDIIISSYHTVRQDIDFLSAYLFNYIILDESQVIKNPSSMVYKSVTRLKSASRLVLTGTPIENSLTDLWAQMNFINPGLLGTLPFFRDEFAAPIEKARDEGKELKLRKMINPFIIRRTKEMVASDLPPVTDHTVYCDMTDEQLSVYEKEKSAVRNAMMNITDDQGKDKSSIIILRGLMRLRQISNHPSMADEDYTGGSGKFDTVMSDIRNVVSEGHKILVFSSFVAHLKLFAPALQDNDISFQMLTGTTTDREKRVKTYQDNPDEKVFLISLKTGGTGLNLTAADYVFILDPWWNPASELQALNRAHRIGQDKSVFVYRYISTGTLEEKILRLQEKKSKLAETFIHNINPLSGFEISEILELIA
jgi:superfamily II DNA or RNA helicase